MKIAAAGRRGPHVDNKWHVHGRWDDERLEAERWFNLHDNLAAYRVANVIGRIKRGPRRACAAYKVAGAQTCLH